MQHDKKSHHPVIHGECSYTVAVQESRTALQLMQCNMSHSKTHQIPKLPLQAERVTAWICSLIFRSLDLDTRLTRKARALPLGVRSLYQKFSRTLANA